MKFQCLNLFNWIMPTITKARSPQVNRCENKNIYQILTEVFIIITPVQVSVLYIYDDVRVIWYITGRLLSYCAGPCRISSQIWSYGSFRI